jgi:hypothetical protein
MMNYKRCMERKCKLCDKKLICDIELKKEALMYKPFEVFFKRLKENNNEKSKSNKTIQ